MSQQLTKQAQLKPFLLASQRQITSLLQDDAKAKRFMAAALVVGSSQALSNCSPDSIVQALIGVAMSDLNIDSNIGHCYLVPYKDTVQLQIGYKGFIQLLYRAGWLVKAFPVYSVDDFSMEFDGWDNRINFIPNIDARDEGDKDWVFNNLRGVYVVSRNAETKDEYSLFVNKSVIEKLRLNSPNQKFPPKYPKAGEKESFEKGGPTGIWYEWYAEMAQAKAIKKLAKTLPIGDARATQAISADDKTESGAKIDYKQSAESGLIIESTAVDYSDTSEAKKDDPYALGTTLSLIENTTSLDELKAIDMMALNAKDQKVAQSAWMKKKAELQPKQQSQALSIADRINACTSAQELNNLIVEINDESVELEHDTLIGEKYDSFR